MLAGALQKAKDGRRADEMVQKDMVAHAEQLEAYEAFCKSLGQGPASVALAWMLHNPAVTAPIIGPRTSEQLQDGLQALEVELDEDMLAKLDEIWPGPGGEAPEAYAW